MSNKAFKEFIKRYPGPYAYQLSNLTLGGPLFDIFCRGSHNFIIVTDSSAGEEKGRRNAIVVTLALRIMKDDPFQIEIGETLSELLDAFQADFPGPYTSTEIAERNGLVKLVTTNLANDGSIMSCQTEVGNYDVANITAAIAEALNNLFERL